MAKKKKPDRLAQEAGQAMEEGMSYGKWKARQFEQNGRKPVYYPEDWEDSDCGDTVCQDCGQLFMGGEQARYCPACLSRRMKESAQRMREKKGADLCTPPQS